MTVANRISCIAYGFTLLFFTVKRFWNPLVPLSSQVSGAPSNNDTNDHNRNGSMTNFKSEGSSTANNGVSTRQQVAVVSRVTSDIEEFAEVPSPKGALRKQASSTLSSTSYPRRGTVHPEYSDRVVQPGYEWITKKSESLHKNVPNFNADLFTTFKGTRGTWQELVQQGVEDIVVKANDSSSLFVAQSSYRGNKYWIAPTLALHGIPLIRLVRLFFIHGCISSSNVSNFGAHSSLI